MNAFSIRDIENICGIKAHTLRVWEQRYQFFSPRRKAGNHREYDSEDLKHLLRIAYLYHNGYKISAIAQLDEKEICQLALNLTPTGHPSEILVNHLIEASLDLDQDRFDRVLQDIIHRLGFEKAITEVAYPFLKRIGMLWLTGNVVPAQEHFASALIGQKIHMAIDGLADPALLEQGDAAAGQRIVLLFTPRGEFHEIPLLYMRYLMKKHGTRTVYFGKDIDTDELAFYCRQQPVTHLYLHLVTRLVRSEPEEYLQGLEGLFPAQRIVISGAIGASLRDLSPRVRVLKGMEEMIAFAAER